MGATTKEVGGESVKGLSGDFVSFLQSILNTGGTGTAGSPDAGGVAGILSSILGQGAGKVGGALGDIINQDTATGRANLNARFTKGGGTGFGTPAAFASSMFEADAAPRRATAIGQLQLSALGPILAQLGGFASKGVTQRQLVQEESPFSQALGTVAGIAGKALPFIVPGFGGAAGAAGGGLTPGQVAGFAGTSSGFNPGAFGAGSNLSFNGSGG